MKMKGLFLAGLLWMTATEMQARGIEHFMDELASQQEVTRVSLGAAAMALGSMFTDTYGVKQSTFYVWSIVRMSPDEVWSGHCRLI